MHMFIISWLCFIFLSFLLSYICKFYNKNTSCAYLIYLIYITSTSLYLFSVYIIYNTLTLYIISHSSRARRQSATLQNIIYISYIRVRKLERAHYNVYVICTSQRAQNHVFYNDVYTVNSVYTHDLHIFFTIKYTKGVMLWYGVSEHIGTREQRDRRLPPEPRICRALVTSISASFFSAVQQCCRQITHFDPLLQ